MPYQQLLKPHLYALLIILGVSLKFYGLGNRLFWVDEVYSVLYTGGGLEKKIAPINQVNHAAYYDKILHLKKQNLQLSKQVKGIFSDTHIMPAHYVFLAIWYRVVGDELVQYRLFSVLFFFLSLPLIFLLSKELFHSSLAGWIASGLFSISPFIHLYAQEARYYSLWVFTFLLCNYVFLKATRNNGWLWWTAYSATVTLALYTSLLSALLLVGHALFLLRYHKNHLTDFLLSAGTAMLLYGPWLLFLYSSRSSIDEELSWQLDKADAFTAPELLTWLVIGSLKYFSFLFRLKEYDSVWAGTAFPGLYSAFIADLLLLALSIYAVYYLIRKGPKESTWFLLLLLVPQYLTFFLSDIIRDGHTSYLIRYQITGMTGLSLVVAYVFSEKLARGSHWFVAAFAAVVTLSIASIFRMSANECWTTRPDCEANIRTGGLLSSAMHSLVITDFGRKPESFLVVLNEAQNKNLDVFYSDSSAKQVATIIANGNYDSIYVVQASNGLLRNLHQSFGKRLKIRLAEENKLLQVWEISKPDVGKNAL